MVDLNKGSWFVFIGVFIAGILIAKAQIGTRLHTRTLAFRPEQFLRHRRYIIDSLDKIWIMSDLMIFCLPEVIPQSPIWQFLSGVGLGLGLGLGQFISLYVLCFKSLLRSKGQSSCLQIGTNFIFQD